MVKHMTKKGKFVIILVFILAILIKEEIYGLLFKATITAKTNDYICNIKNTELEEKYQELVSAYHYEDALSYHVEESKVLFRDVYDLTNTFTIYKGSNNNIKEQNLVVNEQGLIGIISKVNKNSSVVDFLLNENLNLSVKIKDCYGILKYENKELIVKGINNKGEVEIGDEVYTSDVSIYPEGVFIGTVEEIESDHYEIEKVIKVHPSVNFEHIKYVSIITDLRGEE